MNDGGIPCRHPERAEGIKGSGPNTDPARKSIGREQFQLLPRQRHGNMAQSRYGGAYYDERVVHIVNK